LNKPQILNTAYLGCKNFQLIKYWDKKAHTWKIKWSDENKKYDAVSRNEKRNKHYEHKWVNG
jgi:hypothetical protein